MEKLRDTSEETLQSRKGELFKAAQIADEQVTFKDRNEGRRILGEIKDLENTEEMGDER